MLGVSTTFTEALFEDDDEQASATLLITERISESIETNNGFFSDYSADKIFLSLCLEQSIIIRKINTINNFDDDDDDEYIKASDNIIKKAEEALYLLWHNEISIDSVDIELSERGTIYFRKTNGPFRSSLEIGENNYVLYQSNGNEITFKDNGAILPHSRNLKLAFK